MKKRKKTSKRVRTPSQGRSLATVEAILDATTRVLVKRGYAGTTTNHIAETAGVGIASFYAYFPDKDAAIAAVAERFVDQSVAVMVKEGTSVLGFSPMEALRTGLHRAVEIGVANAPLIRVFYQQVPFVWELPKVREMISRLVQLGKGYAPIQNFVPAEEVTDERLYLMIIMLGALIMQLSIDPKMAPRRQAIVDEFVQLVEFGFRGWAAAGGRVGLPGG
ncbi:MAG: TetR/AcrR family transcriptional regulator [Bdellovibrionota bacterium]